VRPGRRNRGGLIPYWPQSARRGVQAVRELAADGRRSGLSLSGLDVTGLDVTGDARALAGLASCSSELLTEQIEAGASQMVTRLLLDRGSHQGRT